MYVYNRGRGRDRYNYIVVAARVVLALYFVLLISLATYMFVHQRSLSALQSSSGIPIFDGRLQN